MILLIIIICDKKCYILIYVRNDISIPILLLLLFPLVLKNIFFTCILKSTNIPDYQLKLKKIFLSLSIIIPIHHRNYHYHCYAIIMIICGSILVIIIIIAIYYYRYRLPRRT